MRAKSVRTRTLWLLPVALSVLGLICWQEIVRVNHAPDCTRVHIVFLVPMRQADVEAKLHLIPEQPEIVPEYESHWANPCTLVVELREPDRLRGQEITVRINRAASRIPLLKKSVTASTRRPVRPALYRVNPVTPSMGPVEILFNTPLAPDSVPGNIMITLNDRPVEGRLQPRRIQAGDSLLEDRSVWLFSPGEQLPQDTDLEVLIRGWIKSAGGLALGGEVRRTVRTAPRLEVLGTKPPDGASGVDLHPEIQVEFSQPLSWGWMEIEGVRGRFDVWANQIQFTPLEPLMPDREFTVRSRAVSRSGEPVHLDFSFRTLPLGDKIWVAVDLEGEHNVTVYRGSEVVRVFKASGGKVTSPTPLGTYFLYSRGYTFWNARLQEGAHYWVRFSGPYLVHSVPFDASGKLKQEEMEKLGQAASHGCIRLALEDARWFFHHVPNGTMIVIYNQH
ncbi:MAG: L,D-transpeptidase family protein [Candidatus Desulforudis sp.]|nr:L,D-transpeptidase family protein [Desulforudis sp.]